MSQDKRRIDLSRRQILAGLGTIGVASAGAGLGTSAYLNDTESFTDNVLTAGKLDLKVDWEEHYYDASTEARTFVNYTQPEEGGVPFPDPENPHVWLNDEESIPQFMDATAIEAFPDPDNDGIQEMNTETFTYNPCVDGADMPDHLNPVGEGALRTNNEDTVANEEPQPLLNLEDVKPGDFGEFTFSFHLCDNPGYLWLQADNVSESENGINDPESEVDESPNDPELAEQIQTAWWYDTDGNNVIDESIGAVDVMLLVDTSGSLSGSDVDALESAANTLASDLNAAADARVGGLSFGGGSIDDFTALAAGPPAFSGLPATGNTPMPAALDIAREELDANGRSNAKTFIVMFTDGGPNYENKTYSAGGYTVGSGYTGGDLSPSGVVHDSELCETAEIAANIRADHRILTVGIADDGNPTGNNDPHDCEGDPISSLAQYLRDYIAGSAADYFSAESADTVDNVLGAILDAIAMPEEVFHRGTLANDLSILESGDGIPLDGHLATEFDEMADPDTHENRECFQAGVNYFVGFAWWLPTDVGNEVQGDSVNFDLGFYAEQCRHNDGSGPTTPSGA